MDETQVNPDVQSLARALGPLPEPVAYPSLIVISGLPGTGKTFFSRKLNERLPSVILESDALRKALFHSPTYEPLESARLFQAIHRLVEELLRKGISVILDATNLTEHYREYLYRIAEGSKARLILVWVEAPPEVVFARLASRNEQDTRDTASEAGWEVYKKLKPTVERIRRKHFVVDTSKDVGPALDKVLKEANK